MNGSSWEGWARSVSRQLEEGQTERKELQELITQVRLDVMSLRARASVWGAVAGAILSLLVGVILNLVV